MREWFTGTYKASRIESADDGSKQRASCVVLRPRRHLPDAGMFMDFLTKWLSDSSKIEASLAYLYGTMARAAYLKDVETPHDAHVMAMVCLVEALAQAFEPE